MGQNVVIKTRGSDDDVWGGHLGPSWTQVGPQDTSSGALLGPNGTLWGPSGVVRGEGKNRPFFSFTSGTLFGLFGGALLGPTGALLEPLGVPWGPKRVPGAISGALGPSVCALGDSKGPKKRQAENL